ncbi:MAG: transglutaminase domain-containing protein [Acetatifactor sp.]|nr:transglutaminase domain-containing protein [Acetatifactor sp.]
MTQSTMQDGMQDIKRDVKQNIKWNARRLVPYLSGVLGSYGIVRELVSLWYGGARVDARSLVLCLALWALLWTRAYGMLYLSAATLVCLCPILHISLGGLEFAFLLCSFVSARAWDRHRAIPVAGGIITVVLLVGSVLGYVEGDAAVEGALLMEQYAHRVYTAVFGESEEGWFENGSVSRGNNYRSGGVILDVAVDKEPTEDIYLRGYVGADYEGDRWTEADESAFYTYILDLTGGMSKAWVQMSHDNLVFELNYGDMNEWVRMLQGQHLLREDARKIVLNKRGEMSRQYIPYYSFRAVNADRYYQLEEGQEVDTYFYFESADMDMEMIKENLERFPQSAAWMREEYENYVLEYYLMVPEERLPRLKALCDANADIRPVTSGEAGPVEAADEADVIDAVTSFIRDTLQADTFYTRTPGNTPVNQDVIEYFLFESRRGYCMHYASAATLMYRMYGIPARYVTGYVAHPQDFKRQADGTYAAALTDYRLHAWVEIYRENLGWTPVEMTPLSYYAGELPGPSWMMPVRTGYMGNGEGQGQGTLAQYAAEEDDEEEEEEEESENEYTEDEEEEDEEEEEENAAKEELADEKVGKKNNLFLVVFGAILAVLCVGALLWYRRRLRLEKLRQMDERRLFYRLLKLLHGTERLRGYTGMEDDFVEKLLVELPVFEEEEATELMRLVEEAAYGPERPTKEENRQQVYAFYERASEELYGRMNHLQRLYCTWILNLR